MSIFRGSQDQRSRLYQQGSSSQSWYPPSVVSSPSSSRPTTPNSTTSSGYSFQRPNERSQSPSHVSPTEAAGIIAVLKEKKWVLSSTILQFIFWLIRYPCFAVNVFLYKLAIFLLSQNVVYSEIWSLFCIYLFLNSTILIGYTILVVWMFNLKKLCLNV